MTGIQNARRLYEALKYHGLIEMLKSEPGVESTYRTLASKLGIEFKTHEIDGSPRWNCDEVLAAHEAVLRS